MWTPLAPGSDTSNQSGIATFTVSDAAAETVTYTATDVTDGISLPATTTVAFTGAPSGAASTVVPSSTTVLADGTTASTITVTILDGVDQAIPGQNVTLSASSGTHSSITATTDPTNSAGVATFTVTDKTAETVTYSATDTSVNPAQKIFATAQVTFAPVPVVTSVSPSYGTYQGGTQVVITGTNLDSATSVMFGSTQITNISVNSRNGTVTVTSPAGVGTVDVRVVTPAATTAAVAADQFSYAPGVTGISPSSGTHLGGTKVTISGINFYGVTAVTFGGTAASFTVNNGTITATSPPGTGGAQVFIEVTGGGGKSADVSSAQFTYS